MTQPCTSGNYLKSRWLWGGRYGKAMLWGVALWGLTTVGVLGHASELFPIPDVIRPNIYFWKKVFAEISASGGILHDMNDLSVIYEMLQELPGNAQERQNALNGYREYYQAILLSLASGKRTDLSADEARVLAMFKGNDSPEALASAAANMRFQSGMREKFLRGIIRSGAYQPDIERIFVAAGLPTELAYLPHVESSFENRALSKVGAAGIWQIMPATGRRFLTVNSRVDERLNISAATNAAARIFQENYEMLGSWPLAITAYNHGLYGMKQAVETMGTTDFGIIFQYYRGPAFGFASQNFYPEFLAALDIARNYKRYFGDIYFDPPSSSITTTQQQRDNDRSNEPTPALALNVSSPPLRHVPAPEPDKYTQKPVPPAVRPNRDSSQEEKTVVVPPPPAVTRPVKDASANDQHVAAPAPGRTYRVQPGDTLAAIARQFHTTMAQLCAFNNLPPRYMVKTGETLVVAASAPPPAEKTAQQLTTKTTVHDARQAVVETGQKKGLEHTTPKVVVGKTAPSTPSQPPAATPPMAGVVAMVTTHSTVQKNVTKLVTPEPPTPVKTATVKATSRKSTPNEAPAAVAVVSVPKTTVAKVVAPQPASSVKTSPAKTTVAKVAPPETPKPVVASTTKAASGKVVTKGASVETAKSMGVSTTKVAATKPPVPRDEPKVTPVSTRIPIRRPNTKGV